MTLSGVVHGGQQGVSGATIMVYSVGTTGNASQASPILTASVKTDANGAFNINGNYNCSPSNVLTYIVATQGNPGLAAGTNNSHLTLMAALGPCNNYNQQSYISINEVTTVAAAWALAPFMTDATHVGSSATNSAGLATAMTTALTMANVATGNSPSTSLATNATLESQKVYSLANVIASCVNSDGTTPCTTLFGYARGSSGSTPTDTLTAALSIVKNPGNNVTQLYDLAVGNAPFPSGLTAPPSDWTMSITYSGGGMNAPTANAIDSTGNAWVANYYSVLSSFSPQGVPNSSTGYTGNGLYESYGMTIDPSNNIWVANEEGGPTGLGTIAKFPSSMGLASAGTSYSSPSISFPLSLASDTNGDIWVADYGHSTASRLNSGGNDLSGNGFGGASLGFPDAIAVDGSHNSWIANQANSAVVQISPAGTVLNSFNCCSGPSGIALNSKGLVWITDYAASKVVSVTSSGQIQHLPATTTPANDGGINHPQAVAIDGADQLWVTNYRGNSISQFTSAGVPLSPASTGPTGAETGGFGHDAPLSLPFGISADASGSLWVSSFYNNLLVEFVGLAVPVKTPLVALPTLP